MNELNMIRVLLDEAPPSAEVAAEGRRRLAAGPARRRPGARWGIAAVGLTAAAAAAIVAAHTLSPTGGAPGAGPRPAASPRPAFGPATTPSGVLRNAALAALQRPAG